MKKGWLFVSILAFACSKEATDPGVTPAPESKVIASFDALQDKFLTPSCATSGCHFSEKDASFAQHKLILVKGKAYANLVGVPSVNAAALARSITRVKKFASNESLFFTS